VSAPDVQRVALARIARSLGEIEAARPQELASHLAPLQRELASIRDLLRPRLREREAADDSLVLERANQVLALLHAAAYPVGSIDWKALQEAENLLRNLLGNKSEPTAGTP
jgi:hypothetical protein